MEKKPDDNKDDKKPFEGFGFQQNSQSPQQAAENIQKILDQFTSIFVSQINSSQNQHNSFQSTSNNTNSQQGFGECPYCFVKMPTLALQDHINICDCRKVTCENCGKKILLDMYGMHIEDCINGYYGHEQHASNSDHSEDYEDEPDEFYNYHPPLNLGGGFHQYGQFSFGGGGSQYQTYEQLLELDKNNVKKGMKKEDINKLKVKQVESKEDGSQCHICLNDYSLGDEIRLLKCEHNFHKGCIDQWFNENYTCPICKKEQNDK